MPMKFILTKNVISGKQKYLGCKEVAWPRKTATATKSTNMRLWPGSICYHNISWYEKVRPIRSFNFLQDNLEDLWIKFDEQEELTNLTKND